MKLLRICALVLAVSAMTVFAGCGGGSTSESVQPLAETARFDLRATARVLFTEHSTYEARSVGPSTPPGRLLLEVRPSAEQVALGSSGSVFEPRWVNWRTTLVRDGDASGGDGFDAAFLLSYTAASTLQTYDKSTGLIGFHDGILDGFPFWARRFQYLQSVEAGGWRGEQVAWLAIDVELYQPTGTSALAGLARIDVRLTPLPSQSAPTQAWMCIEKNYFAVGGSEPYAEHDYCWLIGRDGRPQGPFKARVRTGHDAFTFEGRRL